jgi:hypothetical protein
LAITKPGKAAPGCTTPTIPSPHPPARGGTMYIGIGAIVLIIILILLLT